MKPRILIGYFLLTWVSLLTSGCQSQIKVATPVSPATATTIPSIAVTVSTELTKTPTATQTPRGIVEALPTGTPTPYDLASCEEIFCSANWEGLLSRPISPENRNTIDLTYPYASTRDGTLDVHHGVEFINSSGTSVFAAGDGWVVYAGTDVVNILGPYTGFYGNVVILQHPHLFEGEDVYTLYAHLSEISVAEGAWVAVGEPVGKVGLSGAADGSHLHFEVRIADNDYDQTVNPVLWFSPLSVPEIEQFSTLAGQILDRYGNPVSELTIALEKLGDTGQIERSYYPQTYHPNGINGHPSLEENFVMPDIPAGSYRLSLVYGRLYEIFFTIEPGSLGFISLQLE